MASVWGELKRRNVVKVAVAYAIVGWLLIEVSSTVLPLFEAPDWIAQVFAFFVILGFPLALILSWAYEITPEGMRPSHEVPATESITHATGRKLDFAIIGALVLALGFVVYNYESGDDSGEPPEVAVVEPEQAILPNSVAVIPFENMSVDPEEAFYAAGIHEEILNQLVKLSALNVIARTSMQQYANTEKSIPEIARELNVETVMEGSVRYAGGQIRITAQLNDGITGAHIWSETYTRDFEDIFAIESDVAMNVANAVGAEFSLEEQASIEAIPTGSVAAYALYLSALSRGGSVNGIRLAIQDLGAAIELDADFAVAYALRAWVYATGLVYSQEVPVAEYERSAIASAEQALDLDPTIGLAHSVIAAIDELNWRWADARRRAELAFQLSPNDVSVLRQYVRLTRSAGDYDESIRVNERWAELEPTAGIYQQLAVTHRYARKRAGLAHLRVHDLRHTFGHRLRAAGVSLEDRKALLGHTVGDITTHYSAPDISRLLEYAERICDRDQGTVLRIVGQISGKNSGKMRRLA